MSKSTAEFRWDIQVLRAFAVFAVILFHSNVFLPNGYLGVDVFFVVSGFVISRSVVNGYSKTGNFSISSFVARRVRRLVPALCSMLCGAIVLSLLFESWIAEQWRTQQSTLVALFSFSNIWFLVDKVDYFSPSNEFNLLLHTWSLSVEEQFYIGFALVAALVGILARAGRVSKRQVSVVLFSTIGLSIVIFVRLSAHPPSPPIGFSLKSIVKVALNPFYGTIARSWQFALGILMALYPPVSRRKAIPLSFVCALALVVIMRFWSSSATTNPWLNISASVASVLFIRWACIAFRYSDHKILPSRNAFSPPPEGFFSKYFSALSKSFSRIARLTRTSRA